MREGHKKSKLGPIIIIVCILAVLAVGGYFAYTLLWQAGYKDQESFEKYANAYYDSFNGQQMVGEMQQTIKFGTPLSTAITYPEFTDESEKAVIEQYLEGKEQSFDQENQNLTEEQQAALMIGYESYETDEKVESVAIHEKQILNAATDDEDIPVDSVTAYNFSTVNGAAMSPEHFFTDLEKYQSIARSKIKEQLSDEYKDAIEGADMTNFIMTDSGFRFFFEPGTLAAKEDGVQHFDMQTSDFKDIMKDDIGEHVVDPSRPMVALTYDDGPAETFTAQILDTLEKNNAVATFFELGENVEDVPGAADLLKRELALGCEVGTHSYDHPNLFTMSDKDVAKQATRSIEAIEKATGQKPTIFRAPYGNGNKKIAKAFGLPGINWSVDTLDWESKDTNKIIDTVESFGNLDGQIILMHSIYDFSADASETIIPWLKSQGYQMVTISDLLRYKYNEEPKVKYYGYDFDKLGN